MLDLCLEAILRFLMNKFMNLSQYFRNILVKFALSLLVFSSSLFLNSID